MQNLKEDAIVITNDIAFVIMMVKVIEERNFDYEVVDASLATTTQQNTIEYK